MMSENLSEYYLWLNASYCFENLKVPISDNVNVCPRSLETYDIVSYKKRNKHVFLTFSPGWLACIKENAGKEGGGMGNEEEIE